MHFDLIDEYLLTGKPPKAEVVERLLAHRSTIPAAAPFYEGMKLLGTRTPDLTLVALRLVLAGKAADDAGVVALREHAACVRAGGESAAAAREAYKRLLLTILVVAFTFAFALGADRVSAQPVPRTAPHRSVVRGAVVSLRDTNGRWFLRVSGFDRAIQVVPATAISRDGAYRGVSDLRVGTRVEVNVAAGPNGLVAQSVLIKN